MLLHTPRSVSERRGIVLLVVIALLSLFAAVGLSFVFYADAESVASKFNADAARMDRSDVEPELLLSYFLNQLVYDVPGQPNPNVAHGVYSALRGHSLSRNMYGLHPARLNNVPFHGVGRMSYTDANLNQNNKDLINYLYHPADGFIRDPEFLGNPGRANPNAPYVGAYAGANVPWTYPDHHNLFVAAMNANGELLCPSFHRPWIGLGSLEPPILPDGSLNPIGNGNLTANAAHFKYMTLRPHFSYHPDFPLPDDGGGDVKNLDFGPGLKKPSGGYYNNDSVWMDLGFPVMTGPDGQKFKPLFAALIVDLDGKINLNATGNLRGDNGSGGPVHVSNHGLGPWEINLAYALNVDNINLFRGANGIVGRYGPDVQPGNAGAAIPTPANLNLPAFLGRFDLDAAQLTSNLPSAKWLLPGEAGNSNPLFFGFPQFPLPSYDNASAAERTNHPAAFDYFNLAGGDRAFAASHYEALIRYGGTGSPALGSDLFRLCRSNLSNPRTGRLLTPLSIDIGAAGAVPWLPKPEVGNNYNRYPKAGYAGLLYPKADPADPQPFPPLASAPPFTGEFSTESWNYTRSALQRLNLNRPLAVYPDPNAAGRIIDYGGFNTAQTQRQQFAKEIFDILRRVTTGARPGDALPPRADVLDPMKESDAYKACRWLAQLAVNIVDYRDTDDFITPFHWDAAQPDGWVYGVELPRVLINEAYVEYAIQGNNKDKGMNKGKGGMSPGYSAWVELVNPLMRDAALRDNGDAKLEMPETSLGAADQYPIYQLHICDQDKTTPPLLLPDNTKGDPLYKGLGTVYDTLTGGKATLTFRNAPVLQAPATPVYKASGTNGVDGFFVVGPTGAFPGTVTPSLQDAHMDYDGGDPVTAENPTFVLQRLLCPTLPPNPDTLVTTTPYNPYVTVDYFEHPQMYDDQGQPKDRYSYGRRQPLASKKELVKKSAPNPLSNTDVQNTFFRHNGTTATAPAAPGDATLKLPFDWLVHLNRPLTSPIELLHVPAVPSHLLTRTFMLDDTDATQFFGHSSLPAWLDQDSRLYRFFEFVDIGLRTQGRVAGKININSVWDPEVLRALCDSQPARSTFTTPEVDDIFGHMIGLRSPGGIPSAASMPFKGLAPGVFPGDNSAAIPEPSGINYTLLRPLDPLQASNPQAQRLFEKAGATHPFIKTEILSKIFNNVTTRSNCYAVWLTVGFFQVTDDSVTPPKLGAEIGKSEGRNIRRRMFAILDRSALSIPSKLSQTLQAIPAPTMGNPNFVTVPVTLIQGIAKVGPAVTPVNPPPLDVQYPWAFQPGMQVLIGQEVVTITAVDPVAKTITGDFRNDHPAGSWLHLPGQQGAVVDTILGNPGPQPRFDPRNNSALVLHFNVLQ